MGRQRLHHCVRRVHSDRWRAWRSHRRQTDLHGGFAIFTSASLACALASNSAVLIAARAVQGLGAAVLVPNSLALLNHAYPDQRGARPCGRNWAAGASLALTAGPLAGGALIALIGWRIDLSGQPADRPRRALAELALREETTRNQQREVDLPGQIFGDRSARRSRRDHYRGRRTRHKQRFRDRGLCGLGAARRPVRHAGSPAHRIQCCRCRCLRIGCSLLTSLVGLLVNIAFYGLIFVFSLYFQRINGLSPLQTGLAFVPMMGMVLPANLLAPRLRRIGAPATIAIGGALTALGCLMLLAIEPGTSYCHDAGAAHDHRRRSWSVGAAAHRDAARQCGEITFRDRGRRSQRDPADRQRARRSAFRRAGRPAGYVHARRALLASDLGGTSVDRERRDLARRWKAKLTSRLAECEMGAAKRHHRAKGKGRKVRPRRRRPSESSLVRRRPGLRPRAPARRPRSGTAASSAEFAPPRRYASASR